MTITSASIVFNTSAFRAALLRRRALMPNATKRAAERAKEVVVASIQPLCRVRTGYERDGWARDSYVEEGEDGQSRVVIMNTVEYAVFLNYGTSRMAGTHELQIGMSMAAPRVWEIYEEEIGKALRGQG